MKVLVIGSGGMLGHMVVHYFLECGYEVSDISKSRKCRQKTELMDVLKLEAFDGYVERNHFDAIINCAAVLPKGCASDREAAILLNSYFPQHLKTFAEKTDTYFVQISTGGVYKGDKAPYHEECEQDAVSFYGKTKSLGEPDGNNILTIRSDVVGPDMTRWAGGIFNWAMMSTGEVCGYAHMSINGVTTLEYAKFLEQAMRKKYRGYYNLHADGSISKADFIRLVIEVFHIQDLSVRDVLYPNQNNSLSTIRSDIDFPRKTYRRQLEELRAWMLEHKELYPHYGGVL